MHFQEALELMKIAPTHKSLMNRIFKTWTQKVAEASANLCEAVITFSPETVYG